ncbi:hypothetical protein [Aquirufa echingensis]|uniref:DUF3592 domain-containing protein n=1 Tax=Aquirufa echingensis TaxID=3096516 RepID=A0ABW6CYG0_9BACT
MYKEPLDLIFGGIGLLTIILNRFYINRKKWYWFIIFAFASFYAGYKVNEVIILTNGNRHSTYSTFYSSYDYKFKNGSVKTLLINNNTIINDSDYPVIIEKVHYSSMGGTNNENPYVATIYPYTNNNSLPRIDYIFEEPPQKISEKGGSDTKTRYWLHY